MQRELLESKVIILNKENSGENFIRFELFCQNKGKLSCLSRVAKKTQSNNLPDLFDIATIYLSPARQGKLFFLKEFQLNYRHTGISKSYSAFLYACRWTKLLSMNLSVVEHPEYLFSLTQKTLNALEFSPSPQSAYLKTLYLFARYEGYPIKEDWLTNLPIDLLNDVLSILRNPLDVQSLSVSKIETLIDLIQSWISQETDILFPKT